MKGIRCSEDWRKCGHCKVNSYSPGEDYPRCDRAGFLRGLVGNDMCPNAPWGGREGEEGKTMTKRECYDKYEAHARVGLAHQPALDDAVTALVSALSAAGVSWDASAEWPMSDVNEVILRFRRNGDLHIRELVIGSENKRGIAVCLEPQPSEENENA